MTIAQKKEVQNAGSKGGKFYINSKGHVVYGEKPHGEHPEYDASKPFNEQFPTLEKFNELAKDRGIPEISADDYKQLYQTEHKAYMKKVKESGTKHLKGLTQEQYDLLEQHIFIGEDGTFNANPFSSVESDAKAQGIEMTKEDYMKFYKQVNYKAKKGDKPKAETKPKVEPVEPEPVKVEPVVPEPEKKKTWGQYDEDASISLDKNITVIENIAGQTGSYKDKIYNLKYSEIGDIDKFNTIQVSVPHGMADKRLKLITDMGFEPIYIHATGTENHHTDMIVFQKKNKPDGIDLPWDGEKIALDKPFPSYDELSAIYIGHNDFLVGSEYYKFSKAYFNGGGTGGVVGKGEIPEFKIDITTKKNISEIDGTDFPSYKDVVSAYVKNGHTLSHKEWSDLKNKAIEDSKIEFEKMKDKQEQNVKNFIEKNPPSYNPSNYEMDFTVKQPQDSPELTPQEYETYKDKMADYQRKYMNGMMNIAYMPEKNKEVEEEAQKKANEDNMPVDGYFHVTTKDTLGLSNGGFPRMVFSGVDEATEKVGAILPNAEPWDNLGKMVYWNLAKGSSKWGIGQIVGRDLSTGDYIIKSTDTNSGVSFSKSRPSYAIRLAGYTKTFYPEIKSKLPENDPNATFTNGAVPAFSVKEAKEHISKTFASKSLEEMKKGVTINHDSTMLENLEVKMRYDESSDSYRFEMKLRNELLKNELYDNMKVKGKTAQKIWKGKDEFGNSMTYGLSNLSLYNKVTVKGSMATLEYNGVQTMSKNKNGNSINMNDNSGWAIRDLVTVSIPRSSTPDAGDAYENSVASLKKFMSPETHALLFSKPSDEHIDFVKKMNVVNSLSPKWVDKQNAFTGEYDNIDKNDMHEEITKKLGKDWESKIKYKETSKGYNSYVIEGYHKELEKQGFKHLFTGFGKHGSEGTAIAFSMIKGGGLSSLERHKQGFVNSLSSGPSDYHSGGAEYLFTRMINESNEDETYSGYQSSGVKIRWKPEILDRTDVFCYESDTYGATVPSGEKARKLIASDANSLYHGGNYSSRVTPMSQASNYLSSGNEVMFKKGASPEYIDKVMCHTEHELESMFQQFKDNNMLGSKHPDGRKWTDAVCLMHNNRANATVDKTLTDYIKTNYPKYAV